MPENRVSAYGIFGVDACVEDKCPKCGHLQDYDLAGEEWLEYESGTPKSIVLECPMCAKKWERTVALFMRVLVDPV